MSRRNRNRQAHASIVTPVPVSLNDPRALAEPVRMTDPPPVAAAGVPPAPETIAEATMRPEQKTLPAMVAGCQRLVQHDSVAWWCACGATGRMGRSNDGIPYVNDEILRHAPGERR